jgi:hypothetical protein
VLVDDDFEITVRPVLSDQCGVFMPACFLQSGQIPEAEGEVAE